MRGKDPMIRELNEAYSKGDVADYQEVCSKWWIEPLWSDPLRILDE